MTEAATPDNTLVMLKQVRRNYTIGNGTVQALAGININIRPGGFWAIMGPSGSGKSTLLNILGCLDRPTSGRYILNGHDVGSLDDDDLSDVRLRELGFVFQSFNLIPQLTVLENVELPLFYQGWEAAHSMARATEMIEAVGLSQRAEHRPNELSGGQQQRVAIARALVNNPNILLADEPTGNLDSATGRQIMELFVSLNQAGKTIILVTHEPDVAAFAKTRIHMLDGVIDRKDGEN